jgi:beta-N-acetylhexosaminidase
MTADRAALVIGLSGPELTAEEAALFARRRPLGVILFARNIADPTQLRALTGAVRRALGPETLVMVDQEGGLVARLRPPHWRAHPAAATIGALHARDAQAGLRAAWLTGALIGLDCAACGIDVACAPVLDLRHPGAHDVIGDRAYGAAPDAVAALGGQVAAGLLAAGVQPVMKHAPGHGRAAADSHLELPRVDATDAALAADLAPFALNAGLPWAMSAHVLFAGWDDRRPATLSATVIGEIIRGKIGFDGVLVTDDLAMGALSGPPADRARAALAAGCDVALHCAGDLATNAALLADCPPPTDAALARLARARARAEADCQALDPAALAAERDRLLA